MYGLFTMPGRLIKSLFGGKKKNYRSVRPREESGLALMALSVLVWACLAVGVWAVWQTVRGPAETPVETPAAEEAQAPEAAAPATEPGPHMLSGRLDQGQTDAGPSNAAAAAASQAAAQGAAAAAAPEAQVEAWLVIIHTIPKASRAEAERRQAQYKAKGLYVDILDTDSLPKLLAGNWIIALGPFDSKAEAEKALADAKPKIPGSVMIRRGL